MDESEEQQNTIMRRTQGWYFAPVALVFAVILYLVPVGWAQTVELQINNPPSNNVMDDIYVGSYSANNVTPGGPGGSVQITCDDFRDQSNYESWTYNVNTLTLSGLGNTLWGQALGAQNALPLYEEAAWLTMQMLPMTGTTQAEYSYAIWAIFQPSQVAAWLTSAGDSTTCNQVFGTNAWVSGSGCIPSKGQSGTGILSMAASAEKSFYAGEFSNILILTPQGCGNYSCPEQEFIEVVAEGGTAAMYLLLAGFACFGAMFFRSRLQPSGGTLA
jgi:hypothetical protein